MATVSQPNPSLIFEALNAYQRTAALKGAIELELFTHIADGARTAAEIAARAKASEKGMRVLCDFLTVHGFLTKDASAYGLSQESAIFLNKRSPAYLGSMASFLSGKDLIAQFEDVAAVVRKGGTVQGEGNVSAENPVWIEFARSMAAMVARPAEELAGILSQTMVAPGKVLDIAAGHGLWGIAIAKRNPAAKVVALDWSVVLPAAVENAQKAGVAGRYSTIAGSAFDVDLGSGYDVILVPNFLHHFSHKTNVAFLKKVRAALKPGGMVATVEMVPNEDRISPPIPATFSMIMLGSTIEGDAYTFAEFDSMFREAGFGASTVQDLPFSPEQLILTRG